MSSVVTICQVGYISREQHSRQHKETHQLLNHIYPRTHNRDIHNNTNLWNHSVCLKQIPSQRSAWRHRAGITHYQRHGNRTRTFRYSARFSACFFAVSVSRPLTRQSPSEMITRHCHSYAHTSTQLNAARFSATVG